MEKFPSSDFYSPDGFDAIKLLAVAGNEIHCLQTLTPEEINPSAFHAFFVVTNNGYTTAERFNHYPHRAQEMIKEHPALVRVQQSFWSFWETAYYQQDQKWWLKSATLESNYFPLTNPDGTAFQGSFFLTITPGGLSSIALP